MDGCHGILTSFPDLTHVGGGGWGTCFFFKMILKPKLCLFFFGGERGEVFFSKWDIESFIQTNREVSGFVIQPGSGKRCPDEIGIHNLSQMCGAKNKKEKSFNLPPRFQMLHTYHLNIHKKLESIKNHTYKPKLRGVFFLKRVQLLQHVGVRSFCYLKVREN